MASVTGHWMQVPRTAIEDLYWLLLPEAETSLAAKCMADAALWLLSDNPSVEDAHEAAVGLRALRQVEAAAAAEVLSWALGARPAPRQVPWRTADGHLILDETVIAGHLTGNAAAVATPEQRQALRDEAHRIARQNRSLMKQIDGIRAGRV